MTGFRESAEWALGHSGELIVADELKRRGWYIIPSYDYSGEDGDKAPRIEGLVDRYILPDLDASRDGVRAWAEVKTKTGPTWTHLTGRFEHGIPERHADHYQTVERITGCPVFLFVYETSTGDLLCAPLSSLLPTARHSVMRKNGHEEGAMVFFSRSAFTVLTKELA